MQINFTESAPLLSYQVKMDNAQFERFCSDNSDVAIEREANGTIRITFPYPPITGEREGHVGTELTLYARTHGGTALSSNTGFLLPYTSIRTCSASHVSTEQIGKFSKEELNHFAPIVPEFVVEVPCPTDTLQNLKDKVRDIWLANGVKLAWLIDVNNDKM